MIDKQRKEVTGQGDCVARGWWSEHQSHSCQCHFFLSNSLSTDDKICGSLN